MSHLSDIGFIVQSPEDFGVIMHTALINGKSYLGKGCEYKLWKIDSGVEIWVSQTRGLFKRKSEPGFHPHFVGKTRNLVKIKKIIIYNPTYPTQGEYLVWANQSADKVKEGAQEYPYVFESPDFLLNSAKEDELVNVQITAFAEEFYAFDNVDEYQKGENHMLAPQAFIPSGTFKPDGEEINPPEARAVLTGIVKEVHDSLNLHTGNHFIWLIVESLDANYDVVVDPSLLNKVPKIGGVIFGSFWLSGKIIE